MTSERRHTFALALALLAGGCAASGGVDAHRLPFHVAVVPLASSSVASTEPEQTRIDLAPAILTESIVRKLEASEFAVVTTLPLPPGMSAAEFAREPAEFREEHWSKAAAAAGADLVLDGSLTFLQNVKSEANEKFWLNLPLFLLGGPFCYFVDDHRYSVVAEIDAHLYDLGPVRRGRAGLDRRSQLLSLQIASPPIDLDFIDRADADWLDYGLSLLIPSGFLARRGEQPAPAVEEAVIETLAASLVQRIAERREQVENSELIAPFHLAEASARFTGDASAPGQVAVTADLLLEPRSPVDRLHAVRVVAGSVQQDVDLDGVEPEREQLGPGRERLRYRVSCAIDGADPSSTSVVRLLVADGSRERNVRSFTVRVPPPPAPTPPASAYDPSEYGN